MSTAQPQGPGLHGMMAEFTTPEALVAAAEKTRLAGYRNMDAYSPFPVHGLDEAMGNPPTKLPLLILLAGITGLCLGYGLQYYTSVIDYPLNIGGRPLNSIPSFIPITFECTILLAALTAALGMLALNGFPEPYHPVFNVERFRRASNDRFFLCVESEDPQFHVEKTREFLQGLKAEGVYEVAQ